MVKSEKKSNEVKVTEDLYIFPDGIEIQKEKVSRQVRMSKLNDIEKEQLETISGKSYDLIIAEGLYKKILEEREEDEKRAAALQAQYEADRQRAVSASKKLYDDGLLMIIHEGRVLTALEPVPPISDDDWVKLYNYYCTLSPTMTDGAIKNAFELLFLENKIPGYRFVLFRKNS